MKLSKKPRHYAPRKSRIHGCPAMPNSTAPGHKSHGGKQSFVTFEDALAFILTGTSKLFARRKAALSGKGEA